MRKLLKFKVLKRRGEYFGDKGLVPIAEKIKYRGGLSALTKYTYLFGYRRSGRAGFEFADRAGVWGRYLSEGSPFS